MLYEKKRKKINDYEEPIKNNEDSTLNSDKVKSNEKISSLNKSKKKHFNKLLHKRTFNTQISQNLAHKQINPRQNNPISQDFLQTANYQSKREMKISSYQELQRCKQDEQMQLVMKKSSSNSICSLQLNNIDQGGNNSNRKKFKLYCQLKRKKQNKKLQQQRQIERNHINSTASQSWMKHSIFSKNSQRNDSNSTNKSKSKFDKLTKYSSRKKINLEQKIKQIKSKQKNQSIIQKRNKQDNFSNNQVNIQNKNQLSTLNLKLIHQDSIAKQSEKSSKRSKNSQQKKQTTVNIKKSVIIQKFNSERNSKISSTKITQNVTQPKSVILENDKITSNIYSHHSKQQSTIKVLGQKDLMNKQQPIKKDNKIIRYNQKKSDVKFDRILPQDSQIIQQSVKKLSQIKQEKNQDTFSRSLKINQINSIDHSNSKNNQMTSLQLGIDSICQNRRRSFNYILQTTQLRQSALRKQIQSSLSQLQKTRQQINIQKFKQPKNLEQMMGSSKLSSNQQNMTTIEKIEFHIQIINTLSNFVYKSTQLEYLMEVWDQLNFLIYKKFYIERTKVLNFIKKYPIKNPFCINGASIQTKQLLKALKQNQPDIKRIKQTLQKQNNQIKKNLQVFFSHFDKQKQGQKINLFEYDNFSEWIYKQLWNQIQLSYYSQSYNTIQVQDRICKSLQAGFLISQLNGNFVTPFYHAQKASYQKTQKTYIDDNLEMFQKYVLNKKK